MLLIPAQQNFNVYHGGTFSVLLELKKPGGTEVFPLTGYTVKLEVESENEGETVLVLKEGEGLTVKAAEGEILIAMTPTQTALVKANQSRNYWVSITKAGEVFFPVGGILNFVTP